MTAPTPIEKYLARPDAAEAVVQHMEYLGKNTLQPTGWGSTGCDDCGGGRPAFTALIEQLECSEGWYAAEKDLANRLITALQKSTEQLERSEKAILFLRNDYSEVGAKACPACEYKDGKFIRLCRLHEQIDELKKQLERSEEEVARLREFRQCGASNPHNLQLSKCPSCGETLIPCACMDFGQECYRAGQESMKRQLERAEAERDRARERCIALD